MDHDIDAGRPGTLSDALRAMDSGALTSSELVESALAAADRYDDVLGVFVTRFADRARAEAEAADDARARGRRLPLLGVPVGVKDIIAAAGGDTTAQSLVLDRAWGATEAGSVARLRAAGAVVVGKTTTMEFAFGSPDPGKPFPIPRNPWDLGRWAGGSSSGSGSGVAADMFLAALGTDTGASIRMPAALCGVTGLKPTFGRVPKDGVVPLGYSLDCVGPMARSAEDCARLLAVLAGADPADPGSANEPVPDYPALLGDGLAGLRIGVDPLVAASGTARSREVDDRLDAALRICRDLGAEIVPVRLPLYDEVGIAAIICCLGEAAAYHAPDLRNRWSDYFTSTRLGLGMAAFVSAADYVQAQRVRRLGQQRAAALFAEVDVVITPTVSRPAPTLAETGGYLGSVLAGDNLTVLTSYWNGLGYPALSVPIGFSAAGLPLAMQIAGRPFAEPVVLRVGAAYQRLTDWHLARPPDPAATVEAMAAAAPPAGLPAPSDPAVAMIRHAALGTPEHEIPALAATLPMIRANLDRLRHVDDARYTEPAVVLDTGEPSGGP